MRALSDVDVAECQRLIEHKLKRYFNGPVTVDREDVRSTTMLQILLRMTAYDSSRGSFWTFVDQVATSSMVDQLRAHRRTKKLVSLNTPIPTGDGQWRELSETVGCPLDESLDTKIDLSVAMQGLPEPDRKLLQEKLDGFTPVELAKQYGVARGTIHRRLRAIYRKLRNQRYSF